MKSTYFPIHYSLWCGRKDPSSYFSVLSDEKLFFWVALGWPFLNESNLHMCPFTPLTLCPFLCRLWHTEEHPDKRLLVVRLYLVTVVMTTVWWRHWGEIQTNRTIVMWQYHTAIGCFPLQCNIIIKPQTYCIIQKAAMLSRNL